MQLQKIKLSGFKSFVDPTTVLVPSKLVAVVGPNGCGKSNIIDAVCWVMGESSAKYLRGESLTDVIFNGSTSRKPVGQASVELVFDNQDGSLGGEYANYSEISIRRVINRDSESVYYLNGSRCRRRDIIDIFLGTGLGPRSYSIIGQNMIARIIESKPDDMRTYLEEAAGISKYKDRRRETENRIQHTKENLSRLDDVRTELEKQLGSLKRQSSAAEKFKTLKQDERLTRSRWMAAQWRQFDSEMVQYTLQVQQQETGLEAKQAELTHYNLESDTKRESLRLAGEAFQEVQRRFYTAGNEVSRLEQEIRHNKQRQQQWLQDIAQVDRDCSEVTQNLEESKDELNTLTTDQQMLQPELEKAKADAQIHTEEFNAADARMQAWQTDWDAFNTQTAKATQISQVEQTRIVHLEQRLTAVQQRQETIEREQGQLSFSELEIEIEKLTEQLAAAKITAEQYKQNWTTVREELANTHTEQRQTTEKLDQVRSQLQQLRGQQASLTALQQTALGQRNHPILPWLAKHNLDKFPRLAQSIEVEAGWEQALERVLGDNLQAVCLDNMDLIQPIINELKQGTLCLYTGNSSSEMSGASKPRLIDKVKSSQSLNSLLTGIYIAESLEEAFALSTSLAAHESVITKEGVWLSANWLRVSREENPAAGVFQREQELKDLAKQIEELAETQQSLELALKDISTKLNDLEKQRDEFQQQMNQSHAEIAQLQTQQKAKQEKTTELKQRAERFSQEYSENTKQLEKTKLELTEARATWQQALTDLEKLNSERDALAGSRETLRQQVQQSRDKINSTKEAIHQLEIRLQTTKSQHASLQQTMARLQAQLTTLNERKAVLEKEALADSTIEKLENDLSVELARRLQIENEQSESRSVINTLEHELRELDTLRHRVEQEMTKVRDALEASRLEQQSLKVKAETIVEQINELHLKLEDVLKELPEDVSVEDWHAQLEQINQRISRLGPINLVAIEEYASCSERKEYLDRQRDDLQEGLSTLENAIAKIDKETRARFKETFDKVNDRFKELFPMIFGGGRAYLELTGENLLDSGVAVMACPPGKRNSTIHLLSGGEKTMTAIALVFSIFHLNPAPFCLLDEVDAALDDANIGRFCQLVKTMSDKTQFIFISHNKLAIEMGEHLMGVTMHEPGVSRLVSVNVQEAMSLAGA